jgi:hypothetical protein
MKAGMVSPPPSILIELYFANIPGLAECKGTNNSLKENVPGVKLIIEFNEDYNAEYASYVADPAIVRTVPVEYTPFGFARLLTRISPRARYR